MECVVSNVFKNYPLGGGKTEKALNGISLKIAGGQITSIFGPSGCGKSTLLHIISGLDTVYDGSVTVGTTVLKELSRNKLADFRRDRIGFVFQSFNLLPHLSVKDNLLTALYLREPSARKRTEKITEVLSDLDIPELLTKRPNELSGGQRQRVAIARALMNDPDLIIADEPTGALDVASQKNVLAILRKLSGQGKTVVIVTHNPEVGSYSDTVVHMRDGQLIGARPPAANSAVP